MRDYAAERFEDGSRALFNRTHPLAEAIMKGWKERSPVDCLIISPDFELMGRQLVNELYEDSNRKGLRQYEYYLTFLQQALAGKQPGLGDLILTREAPSQEVLDVFRTPTVGYQDWTVVVINTTDFENGGTLTINIEVGREDGVGGFYLFSSNNELSTDEKTPKDTLARTWIGADATRQITHRFDRGQLFKLGATGHWDRAEPYVNAFRATASVQENSNEGTHSTGLRVVLDSTQSSQEILDIFRAPGEGYQDYTVVNIDATAFDSGGTLIIDVHVGSVDISGSFDLFDGDTELPTEGYPEAALTSMWGVRPNQAGQIRHLFARGKVFKFGATGDWYGEKGRINAFQAHISVEAH